MEATAAWVGQGGGAFGRLGDSSTFGLPTVSLLTHSVLTAQQSFINLLLYSTKLAVSGGKKNNKKNDITPKTVCFIKHRRRLVFMCPGWIQLTLAQRLSFSPASFGWSVLRHGGGGFVFQQQLQRAVSVVVGRADLAAAVGGAVRDGGRRRGRRLHFWMRGAVGLNSALRLRLIRVGQLSRIGWMACYTVLTAAVLLLRVAGAAAGRGGRRRRRPAGRHALRLVQ